MAPSIAATASSDPVVSSIGLQPTTTNTPANPIAIAAPRFAVSRWRSHTAATMAANIGTVALSSEPSEAVMVTSA